MKKFVPILILIALLTSAIPTSVAFASVSCKSRYVVQMDDTLRMISKKFNVHPWDIIHANNDYMQKPNYPFYVGERLCIPDNSGTTRFVSNTVLDAPAAEYYAKYVNGQLKIFTVGFAVGSNWTVKTERGKIGKIRIINKNWKEFSFRLSYKPTTVVLKNQLTDAVLFIKVK